MWALVAALLNVFLLCLFARIVSELVPVVGHRPDGDRPCGALPHHRAGARPRAVDPPPGAHRAARRSICRSSIVFFVLIVLQGVLPR